MDAYDLGIEEGDLVVLKSPWGEVRMKAHPTWEIMPSVIGAVGGFGHWRGLEGDPKYTEFGGDNAPGIGKPNTADEMGGTTLLKYITVRIEKAA